MKTPRPALFLDRDGVINVDSGYIYRKEDFIFVDGIFELVAAAKNAGFLCIIVTNQAGIGRGMYSEAQFHELMDWVSAQFMEHGGQIDATYFCPNHPEHGLGKYKKRCDFRKPRPGMILQATADLGIDLARSLIVGDKVSDIEAGFHAGVPVRILFGCREPTCVPHHAVNNLSEVLAFMDAARAGP